jgi:hypothetical protein
MKPRPCLQVNHDLETAAQLAEQRKHQAIDELLETLTETAGPRGDEFEHAMQALIDADKAALKARGR